MSNNLESRSENTTMRNLGKSGNTETAKRKHVLANINF